MRCVLVAPLPSEPSLLVDLHRVEQARLEKLGEGRAEEMAAVLVPPSLRLVLESGARVFQRIRQTLAYAEKWHRLGGLPVSLARSASSVGLLPCLPSPAALRRWDGSLLDHLPVRGPGGTLGVMPQPTVAVVGLFGEAGPGGWCPALEDATGVLLGGWLVVGPLPDGPLELHCGSHFRRIPVDAWAGLAPPVLRAAEVVLLPPPQLRPHPGLASGCEATLATPFEVFSFRLDPELPHLTVQ